MPQHLYIYLGPSNLPGSAYIRTRPSASRTRIQGQNHTESSPLLECYSCIDKGDHGCSAEKAVMVSCLNQDVCVEAVAGVQTTHEHFSAVIKGCGMGGPGKLDKAFPFNGLTIFIQVHQCNTSRCNTLIDLEKYVLIPIDTSAMVPNGVGCYGCIGKSKHDECTPTTAPEVSCFNDYTSCFDGNTSVTVGNSTVNLPIKSCSKEPVCVKETLRLGGATFHTKGACCSGQLCNQDLSNKTQNTPLPMLVVLLDGVEQTTSGDNKTRHNGTQAMAMSSVSPGGNISTSTNGTKATDTASEINPLDNKPMYVTSPSTLVKGDANLASRVNIPVWAIFFLATFSL
ncbi:ly6/PLAUR domain-containing protein 3-like [Ambystoma mexicanum]|uniref:ly6/PLAUR domain-containing protein 3-like n=1 Tax=Ambystoma mexicanum TaxID=8296 RepID=UPI0037E7DFAA